MAGWLPALSNSTPLVPIAEFLAISISLRLVDQLSGRLIIHCSLAVPTARLSCAWCQPARLILTVPHSWDSAWTRRSRMGADRVPYSAMKVFARAHRVTPRLLQDLLVVA